MVCSSVSIRYIVRANSFELVFVVFTSITVDGIVRTLSFISGMPFDLNFVF